LSRFDNPPRPKDVIQLTYRLVDANRRPSRSTCTKTKLAYDRMSFRSRSPINPPFSGKSSGGKSGGELHAKSIWMEGVNDTNPVPRT
jgi:hypothetical protein